MESAEPPEFTLTAVPTICTPAESNVIGHVVVLHDPDDNTKRIACGEIKSQP